MSSNLVNVPVMDFLNVLDKCLTLHPCDKSLVTRAPCQNKRLLQCEQKLGIGNAVSS